MSLFAAGYISYTAKNTLLRFGAERLDDGAEVVVSVPSFGSHVLGVDCGDQRKRLRRLVGNIAIIIGGVGAINYFILIQDIN